MTYVARESEQVVTCFRKFTDHTAVIVLVVFIIVICSFILLSNGISPFRPDSYLGNFLSLLAGWIFLLSARVLLRLVIHRPESPISDLVHFEFGPDFRSRLPGGGLLLVALFVFMPTFSAMKSAIPLMNPSSWDETFISLDRVLHGNDPWLILQPILGNPLMTSIISMAYHGWILLIFMGGVYFAFHVRDTALINRYFLSFFAMWTLIGMVMATAFASVGPCFVAPLLGLHDFDKQMSYLHEADEHYPIMVLHVQEQLLEWRHLGSHGFGRGITAMPSMHVALAFLYALAMFKISRFWGVTFSIFCFVIFLGSVHLGYHYAVDGYVSVVVTLFIWKLAGLWVRYRSAGGSARSIATSAMG